MPYTGDLPVFMFSDELNHCTGTGSGFQAGNGGNNVTLNYSFWSDTQIVISGFAGLYRDHCWMYEDGDPIFIGVWNSADPNVTYPGTGWGGRTPVISSALVTEAAKGFNVTVWGQGFGKPTFKLPFTGFSPNFRIGNKSQGASGEWGYTGDKNELTYLVWNDSEIQVTGLTASEGDLLEIALWSTDPYSGDATAVNVTSFPKITNVELNGTGEDLQITVSGVGFGAAPEAMPHTGNLNFSSLAIL